MKGIKTIGTVLFFAGFIGLLATLFISTYRADPGQLADLFPNEAVARMMDPVIFNEELDKFTFSSELLEGITAYNDSLEQAQDWNNMIWGQDDLVMNIMKSSGSGFPYSHSKLLFLLIFGIGILGALLMIFPKYKDGPAGIKNNGVFHSSLKNRGVIGILLGTFLIGFYIVIYWWPYYLTEWTVIVDPLARAISGGPASQWFFYGLMYTIIVMVMGVRFYINYRHSKYHTVRTMVVTFFQLTFAFMIPHILTSLNKPGVDLKLSWPLDYAFFFQYRIDALIADGTFGYWLLGWGIILFLIGVPVMTYFLGKRWYCSWVCGCGGLAETAGDPFRHQSDKSLRAWRIERWVVHLVMVFALVLTIGTVYALIADNPDRYWVTPMGLLVILGVVTGSAIIVLLVSKAFRKMDKRVKIGGAGVFAILLILILVAHFTGNRNVFMVDSYKLQSWYGFWIGAIFAGVVGTGFYPLMGNRVWCRFGCPLAGYLGIIQRFKSRFRITTNGGQCISCGNCSTYCEQGIDVRSYAQRGVNIVRSSCVGCGVCSSVCPRGVLRLENGPEEGRLSDVAIIVGNDGLLQLNQEEIEA